MPRVFKASYTKRAFVSRFLPEQLCWDLSRQMKKLLTFNWQHLNYYLYCMLVH